MRHAPAKQRANSWEDIADLSARFGVVLDEWQEIVLQAAMGERQDGRWQTPQVALSTPRQNGKSQLIVARALAGILLFDEKLIIISAHQQDTAREVFTRLVDILEDHEALNSRVETYGKALGREYIRFRSGQVIRFKARSAGGGRGFSCDCLMLDEAQILGSAAWSAILPTMSARPNPQVWLLGTPPTPADDGEVFTRFRQIGLEAKQPRVAYLEWSAEPTDDLDDPRTWAKANPSYGSRISEDAVAAERAAMSDTQFAMERLGIWAADAQLQVIPEALWNACATEEPPREGRVAYAIDMKPDRSVASISAARQAGDSVHVEVVKHMSTEGGSSWVVEWLSEGRRRKSPVFVDAYSPAASLVPDLERARVNVTVTHTSDLGKACGAFADAVKERRLTHYDQDELNAAVMNASKRNLGDGGAWAWNRKDFTGDISPLVSATLAAYGLSRGKTGPARPPRRLY